MLNLHIELYQTTKFSALDEYGVEFFLTNNPFYYSWRKDKGLDIIKFSDQKDINTIQFYRYSRHDLLKGIDIEIDSPSLEGKAALEFLRNEYLIYI
jgi:hypothetical protein